MSRNGAFPSPSSIAVMPEIEYYTLIMNISTFRTILSLKNQFVINSAESEVQVQELLNTFVLYLLQNNLLFGTGIITILW
mgnify:CR=1 FL=1